MNGPKAPGTALRIALVYTLVATLWIVASDAALRWLGLSPETTERLASLKGVAFVIITAVLLAAMLRRMIRRIESAHRREIEALAHAAASQGLFAEISKNVSDAIIAKDAQGRFILFNRAAERISGHAAAEVLGRGLRDIFPEAEARQLEADDERVLRTGEVFTTEETLTIGGGTRTLFTVKGPIFDAAGVPSGTFAVARDVTLRKQAESELRLAAAVFESQDGIVVTDSNAVIQRINPAFTRITGYSAEEAVGRTPSLLQSGVQSADFYGQMWRRLSRDGYWQGELVNRHRDGGLFNERLAISAIRDASGAVLHYVGSLSDITREKEATARADRLRNFDPLTELPNRTLLHDRLAHALQAHAHSDRFGAVLMANLDNFKNINDSLGHAVGDLLLLQVAQRLRQQMRDQDTVARFSGDTFAVVLEALGDDADSAAARAANIGEQLVESMRTPFVLEGRSVVCTVSVGLTSFCGKRASDDVLLRQAELAMYRAKSEGRDTLRFFEREMQTALDSRNALETDLRRAIDQGQLLLHFQAQVDRQHRVIGAEALLRWAHPARGLVAPGEFIALAEQTGLIEPIGQFVVDAACRQLAAWARQPSTRALRLSVNVSARQFRQPDFVDKVLQSIDAAGVDPAHLELEITESLLLADMDAAVIRLNALKARGVQIALDDFGTGSSSLAYLTLLPLDQIKIDKSFVENLPDTRNAALVVQAILALGKGLGLQVVAEGVETVSQLAFLGEHDCDAFQGFLFSKPVPVAAFESLVGAPLPVLPVATATG